MGTASKTRLIHTRLLPLPHGENSLAGARLDALREEQIGAHNDLVMDFHELRSIVPPLLRKNDGAVTEQIEGVYIPRRLRFSEVKFLEGGAFAVEELPADHPGRALTASQQWCAPDGLNYYLIGLRARDLPDLLFTAQKCSAGERSDPTFKAAFVRDWSPSPASPPRLVPRLTALNLRYGGDPVAVTIEKTLRHRLLFTGGVDIQPEQRPEVDAVLNLGEIPSRWAGSAPLPAPDRWTEKGEGSLGMDVDDIRREAAWVIERLEAGQRVLVHCAAGMNRSATVCCAALILLERLSAEAALARVREFHPWARPDSRHWLALRWLAKIAATPRE